MADLAKETWFVAAQNDGLVIIDGPPSPAPYDGPIPKKHGPSVIATPNWRRQDCEGIARLIAAAPDLLDALREAKGLADMAVMSDDLDGTPSEDQAALVALRAKIDAAISKATSRQPEGER